MVLEGFITRKMKDESIKFMALLAARRHPQQVYLRCFDTGKWFTGAYRTIQRQAPKMSSSDKQNCRDLIFNNLRQLQSETFDTDIERLIETVSGTFHLTIGQSQKLINILLKYHACLFYSQTDQEWNEANEWIQDIHSKQHVPSA